MTTPSHRPVFIIGCPRSGTTLLQQMLHLGPRIALPAETRIVHTAYRDRREFGDLTDPANRRALAGWITGRKDTKFAALGLDARSVAEEIVAAPPTLGSALATVFRAYARENGKPRWGDKRPSYFRMVPMLLRLFPDAQFVHLVRDGRDAASSLRQMPWYKGDIYSALLTWREAVDRGRQLAARLPPDAYHQLRYEDLAADPEAALRPLCAFLGEEYAPAMAEPHHLARRTVPAERRWHHRTLEAVDTKVVGAWQDRLRDWEVELAEHVFGPRLAELGYAPSGAGRPPSLHLTRFRQIAAVRWRRRHEQEAAERYRRLREPNPVVSLLTGPAT
ncbi:sulfotransferase family protein [Actinomadura parmotrematis]|uniref:Sulfotransferase n=1 Tax=Actinomadura parmotrematis TaxID=2864039 RepID=A0ABS7FYY8_9ACTN|nr:sulfotransferase [Actinomadura parmotrematis]MBW8485661.1 sulfotransferase [Actinomadura parmotrematis]